MERTEKNPLRQDAQSQFGNIAGHTYFRGVNHRGAFQGPMSRPCHPYNANPYGEQFHPNYRPSHSHDYRTGFFSPPRVRHLHHEKRYGEFTPPRPFHGTHRGGRQNSRQWDHQQNTKPKNGNAKFNSHKYFKESMLEDPWKELIEKKQAQTTNK